MDAGSAPERIGKAHLPDQSPNFWRDAGPAGTPTRFPAPEGAKACEEHPPDQVEQVAHRAFITRFGPSGQADGICGSHTTITSGSD